jgi:hypothetical protein
MVNKNRADFLLRTAARVAETHNTMVKALDAVLSEDPAAEDMLADVFNDLGSIRESLLICGVKA